ncbi:MAG: class I SAM-dependent methyltransferase [Actinomycetota bacterium]
MAGVGQRWSGYELMARHVAPANRHLLDLLGLGPGLLLDIGAGSGGGLEAARKLGWAPVGLELSPEQLAVAGRCGLPLVRADAQQLPVRPASFDAAISNFGLIFAPEPERVVAETVRMLRPGGALAFTAWTPGGWPGACRAILAELLGQTGGGFPTHLGETGRANEVLSTSGLTPAGVDTGVLRWQFRDLDDAVDTLTSAAGGLRLLRRRAESEGVWPAARDRLVEELSGRCVRTAQGLDLFDHYVAAVGIRRQR